MLSLGFMPPVNQMVAVGEVPRQLPWFPTTLLYCGNCELVQLGLAVDPVIIFPPEYPYTSGMTKLLRDNFAELYAEVLQVLALGKDDLVVDIGSNDGTLLSISRTPAIACSASSRRGRRGRAQARHRHADRAYFGPRPARKRAKRSTGRQGGDCSQRVRPHRKRARRRRRHRRVARHGRRVHLGVALSARISSRRCSTTRSITSICATTRSAPSKAPLEARARSLPRQAHPDPRRLDPRLCRAKGHATNPASVKQTLDGEPSGDAIGSGSSEFRDEVVLSKMRLHALIRDVKERRKAAASSASALPRALRRLSTTSASTTPSLTRCARWRARRSSTSTCRAHSSPWSTRPALCRPTGMRHPLLLAHR